MTRSRFSVWLSTMLLLFFVSQSTAQTGVPDDAMRLIASRSVGMPESTFEVSSTATVLTVVRVNSTMNASTHQGRNNEAAAIKTAIADEFTRRGAQYSSIHTIGVVYVERTGAPAHDNTIDRIDFRKNADGKFELHIT